jgi:phosphatidylglycerophosphatase A
MKRTASKILATFFGLGFFPVAPGTVASAAAALGYKYVLHGSPWPLYVLLLACLFIAGAAASAIYSAELGRPDPGRIVVDEVCGQLVALAFLPAGWPALAVSFFLFRLFDIIKPWPIRRLEKLPGGWGIMADDLGAGLAAAALGRLILLWI